MSTFGNAVKDLKKVRVYFAPGDGIFYQIASFDEDISGWTFEMNVADTDKRGNEEILLELTEGEELLVDEMNSTVTFDIPGEDTEQFEVGDRYVGVLKITGTGHDPRRTHRVRFIPQDYNSQ